MRRAIAVLALAAGFVLASASPTAAQLPITFAFGASPADTASGLVPGATPTAIPIRMHFASAATSVYSYGYAVQAMQLTVHFDPALVEVVGAGSSTYGLSVTGSLSGTGAFTVNASYTGPYAGVYGVDAVPLQITARLLPGASSGAYLWIEPGPATACYQNYYYYSCSGSYALQGLSGIGQACHATAVWGDVDGNQQVESRDALIALSAAVGLTVAGTFDLAMGDVDGDGLTNSRDALMMLSYAVGLAAGGSGPLDRVGVGIADACPGLTPPGETVVFNRNLGGTGGVFRLDSLATTPVQVTSVLGDQWPRLNAGGSAITFQCPDTLPQVCRVDATGANRTLLTGPGAPSNTFPDWSPGGTSIAYLQGSTAVYTMDSTGGNQSPAYPAGMPAASVAWSRDGSLLGLIGPSNLGIYTTTVGTLYSTPLDLNYPSASYAPPLRWSPDGTALAFVNFNGGGILTLPAAGGTSVPAAAPAGIFAFDWGPQGVIFALPDAHGAMSLWMLQGGFGGPVVRLTNPGFGSGQADDQPSFRRNP